MAQTYVTTENPLGYEKISILLRKFAIPSIIAMLVSSLYNVVDQIFIGQGVGFLGNAATNVAFPLITICMAITLTISIGSAARFSLALGRKQEDIAASVVGCGFCMMVLFGIIYVVFVQTFLPRLLLIFGATPEIFDYAVTYTRITTFGMPLLIITNGMSNLARADGSPFYSMITMVIGAVLNTILDPLFIFVFHLGVAGAAWATVIGQAASFLFAIRYFKLFKRVRLHKNDFTLSLTQIRTTAAMGMSNGLTQLAMTLVQIVMNRSLVYYGGLSIYGSEIPLASSGIVMKVTAIVFSIIIGIMQGMQPIIGFNYGAKLYDRVKGTYKLAITCELIISCTALFIFQVFPHRILAIFGKGNDLYYEFSILFMRSFLLFMPLGGIQAISSNFFAAIGKPIKGALLSLTRQVFFLIPLVIILPIFFGIRGILATAPIADMTAFIVVLFFIIKEMRSMHE
ncbi:MAG: MATE family efflux transporter [Treponema sp.]|nr:MATE family efflux transporter [Treponema sp.]